MTSGSGTVLYLVSRFGVDNKGGVERVADLLMKKLESAGRKVVLVDEKWVLPAFLGKVSIAQFLFPVFSSAYLWWARFRHSDMRVISNGSYAAFFPADVVIMHGSAAGYVAAMQGRTGRMLGMRVMAVLEAWAMRLARKVICVSDDLKDYVVERQKIKASKCSVAYNGVVVPPARSIPRLDSSVVSLGFAGRLEYGKGVDYLIALADALKKRSDARLVIAALGAVPAALADNPQVDIIQGLKADDMHRFYERVDIFILPTRFEGFELVTLEALASGVPVLGRPIGACGLLLRRNVPWVARLPDEVDTLLANLPRLADEFRACLDEQAMQTYVSTHFSLESFCNEVMLAIGVDEPCK